MGICKQQARSEGALFPRQFDLKQLVFLQDYWCEIVQIPQSRTDYFACNTTLGKSRLGTRCFSMSPIE